MDDKIFDKVKKKTNVDKETIISMAQMINENGLKDEKIIIPYYRVNFGGIDFCVMRKKAREIHKVFVRLF